jgi:hypothetical protein
MRNVVYASLLASQVTMSGISTFISSTHEVTLIKWLCMWRPRSRSRCLLPFPFSFQRSYLACNLPHPSDTCICVSSGFSSSPSDPWGKPSGSQSQLRANEHHRAYYSLVMIPIVCAPLVKFFSFLEYKPTIAFSVTETCLVIIILVLYEARKSGPASHKYYFGHGIQNVGRRTPE